MHWSSGRVAALKRMGNMDTTPSSRLLLAYVFWHWPPAAAVVPTYEADLVSFHASLASRPPAGFVRSATFVVSGASWLPEQQESYEGWYLVRDWAAVGELNHDAVATAHAASHDRIAHQADSGAGGLYALRAGDDAPGQTQATWFAKPPGWSYGQLDTALDGWLDEGIALWQRQMALGPAPEFCLRGSTVPTLPAPMCGQRVACRALR